MKKIIFLFLAIVMTFAFLNADLNQGPIQTVNDAVVRIIVWSVEPSGGISRTKPDNLSMRFNRYNNLSPIYKNPTYHPYQHYNVPYSTSEINDFTFPSITVTARKNDVYVSETVPHTPPLTVINIFLHFTNLPPTEY